MELAVAYAAALSGNHPFFDGNKRVAFHAMLVFLRFHALTLRADTEEATRMMLALAAGEKSEAEMGEWVKNRV